MVCLPRIEGYAVVSADGMLADASGVMPRELYIDADQQFFTEGLNRADAVVHGRNSQESHPNSPQRRRLIVTRSIASLAPDPANPHALLWNPAGCPFDAAWEAMRIDGGVLGVLGGTHVFGLFLTIGYDAFHLSRAAHIRLPSGRAVFPDVPRLSPETILANHGLRPGPETVLDPTQGLTLVTWER